MMFLPTIYNILVKNISTLVNCGYFYHLFPVTDFLDVASNFQFFKVGIAAEFGIADRGS